MITTKKLIHPCSTITGPDDASIDIAYAVASILLFDSYIIKSHRLCELPVLVGVFGPDGMKTLLDSGILSFACNPGGIARFNHLSPRTEFKYALVFAHDRKEYVSRCLSKITSAPDITYRQAIKLKPYVAAHIEEPPSNDQQSRALSNFFSDLRSRTDLFQLAIREGARRNFSLDLPQELIDVSVEQTEPNQFLVKHNLDILTGLSPDQIYHLVGDATLALAKRWSVVTEMEQYNAIGGATTEDLPLFDPRLTAIEKLLDPSQHVAQFYRVTNLIRVPVADASSRLNAKELVSIHRSSEAVEFRSWIQKAGSMTDEEIGAAFAALSARAGIAIRSPVGKFMRWLVTTAAGAIPGVGIVAGGVAGAVDSLLLEALLPKRGPVMFMNELYPSLFEISANVEVPTRGWTGP
jgi:hypothetical protein